MEVKSDYNIIRSTYNNSRINNGVESSAGGQSRSEYESNRNFTQLGLHAIDITNISPMAGGAAHLSRFDRSD